MRWSVGFLIFLTLVTILSASALAQPTKKGSSKKNDQWDYLVVKIDSTAEDLPSDLKALIARLGGMNRGKAFPALHKQVVRNPKALTTQSLKRTPTPLDGIYNIELPAGALAEPVLEVLRQHPAVTYAEPHYEYEPLYVPSDPHAQPGTGNQRNMLALIKAWEGWDVQQGSDDILIGLVDTGFNLDHPDLRDNVAYNLADPINGIDDDGDGYVDNYAGWDLSDGDNDVMETWGHGSQVAGMASATFNNGKGIAGIGGKSRFLPIKIYGDNNGRFRGYEGIVYAAEHGCKVINLSWGRRGQPSAYEQDIINYAALTHDAVLVAAAGNDGVQSLFYPASYDHVISVTGVGTGNRADRKVASAEYNTAVDLAAPGEGLYSTNMNGGYSSGQTGTSFASPIVAGAAALVRAHFPELSADQVAARLKQSADPIDHLNAAYAGKLGNGRLNLYRALTETNLYSVSLKSWQVATHGMNTAWPGEAVPIWCTFSNYLSPLERIDLLLTTSSPYVTVIKDDSYLEEVRSGDSARNTTQPFRIKLAANTPAWHNATFTVIYKYAGRQEEARFTVAFNPDYIDLSADQVLATITSTGRIGFNDVRWMRQGNGFKYQNTNLLREAGLIVALAPDRVSDCVRNDSWSYNDDFKTAMGVYPANTTDRQLINSVLTDEAAPGTAGVRVTQRAYAWQAAPLRNTVVMEYRVENITNQDFEDLYVGLYADWNVGVDAQRNGVAWDASHQLSYTYDQQGGSPLGGIALLSPQQPTSYALSFEREEGPIILYDGLSKEEKHQAFTNGTDFATLEGSDVSNIIGARVAHLNRGESATIAFALLAEHNLDELQATTELIAQQFRREHTGPVPTGSSTVYEGDSAQVQPRKGSRFRFYYHPDDSLPFYEGAQVVTTSLQRDTVFYVSNTDSLFESKKATYRVNVLEPGVPLPIELTSFTASAENEAVVLRWVTASETNNAFFTVERSADGVHFEALGRLDGAGTSQFTHSYHFTDPSPLGGLSYYRLRQTDYDGASTTSSLRSVQFGRSGTFSVRAFPNPTRGSFNLALRERKDPVWSVTLVDMTGRQVYHASFTEPVARQEAHRMENLSLQPGVYLLQVRSGQDVSTQRLVVE
ncbi:Por secretion system C-terminal sorting domain-containing protein [Catalinimonas alkaloidigena]|uniref:Por secretion system C-terminal sorting domain-containing protein n=1 Tax=Catalinimonas alkaloidigena TaxID=1075417 RepID=A0A1G9BVP9_9BACT|nr:S8 family serine peptidase [Catalinimonas alkaloidigena]SDK43460.1 Por secretion system C-terminal sorting domain-containing protein [Catalinimonas alkaloidigena]